MRLSFTPVTKPQEFRDLLIVRNECREGMTHQFHEITLLEQKKFMNKCWFDNIPWSMTPHPRSITELYPGTPWVFYEPYLLYNYDWPVGFAMLKFEAGKYWMTIGVAKDWRGKGLSHLLTDFITAMGHREGLEVWLDCHIENFAYSVYLKHGYEVQGTELEREIVVMKHVRA